MSKEYEYFNCSEEHEIQYVGNLYTEPTAVKKFLREKCADGTICNWTHKELYDYLKRCGFTKK